MRLSTLRSAALVAAAFALLVTDASAQTIAAARAAGPGGTVTLTAVVSRAKGAFVQMQDATAGISIRETAATNQAFFDAVANGTIAPGTTLTVTGVTSEFNGLFQINGADLTNFVVGATVAVPAVQDITLAQLGTDGEQYESELVRIQNVNIAGSGVFVARTNYDLTQGGAVGLMRIVNAGDTDVDDTTIPTGAANIVGVVGQFDPDGLAGYQIQPVNATDVSPFTVSSEAGAESGLSMRVANPLRGTATVRFEVEQAGQDARLALYDVLGRQVATLATGAGAGAQTATLDASRLAPGVYVLRLTAGTSVLTQTVSVVR